MADCHTTPLCPEVSALMRACAGAVPPLLDAAATVGPGSLRERLAEAAGRLTAALVDAAQAAGGAR